MDSSNFKEPQQVFDRGGSFAGMGWLTQPYDSVAIEV
jgi:hypothetical protein